MPSSRKDRVVLWIYESRLRCPLDKPLDDTVEYLYMRQSDCMLWDVMVSSLWVTTEKGCCSHKDVDGFICEDVCGFWRVKYFWVINYSLDVFCQVVNKADLKQQQNTSQMPPAGLTVICGFKWGPCKSNTHISLPHLLSKIL